MKKIVCPVDFSEASYNAVATAAKLAQQCGAQLHLLNAQSVQEITPAELLWGKAMKVEAITTRLKELSMEVSRAYRISCYEDVQSSNQSVSETLSDTGSNYDLIVMGTNGTNSVYDLFFGTNSYRVARESTVPVLLLPGDYEFAGFSNIVFAADYFNEPSTPPEQLINCARMLNAHITFLQIMTKEYQHEQDEKLLQIRLSMQQFLGELFADFKTLYANEPLEGIIDYVKANECDALALCFRHHSMIQKLFHKNAVKSLCANAPCPLFIFHQ